MARKPLGNQGKVRRPRTYSRWILYVLRPTSRTSVVLRVRLSMHPPVAGWVYVREVTPLRWRQRAPQSAVPIKTPDRGSLSTKQHHVPSHSLVQFYHPSIVHLWWDGIAENCRDQRIPSKQDLPSFSSWSVLSLCMLLPMVLWKR